MIYQFKVTLKNVGIPVWRRIQVDSETTFEQFHYMLMAAFDWLGYHLHEFEIRRTDGIQTNKTRIGQIDDDSFEDTDPYLLHLRNPLAHPNNHSFPRFFEEKNERLSNWFKSEKDRALYTYDFGDNWEHEIVLEKILGHDLNATYPVCTKAKNDAPLEDSRMDMLDDDLTLTNPNWKLIVEDINDIFSSEGWETEFIDKNDFI